MGERVNPFAIQTIPQSGGRYMVGFIVDDYAKAVEASGEIMRCLAEHDDLVKAQTIGSQVNTPDFLDWIADRLVRVYGEDAGADFVLSLRARAAAGRATLSHTTKEAGNE